MKKIAALIPLLLVSLSLPAFPQQKFNSDAENAGAGCPAGPAPAFTATGNLPDPFLKFSGTRVASKDEWWCRRQEMLTQLEAHVYGPKPPKPAAVTGTVSRNGGTGTITVSVTEGGKTVNLKSMTVTYPATGTAPYPAVIVYGGGADAATIRGQGVATISYDPYDAGAEGTGRASKGGKFYDIYGSNSKTGLLGAWAWGVSRIIDVIEQSDGALLKADAIGVTGCSRFGKGAFAAGALDQRVALTMPMESGTAGVPAFRTIAGEGAQSLASAYGEQPWFGDGFSSFTGSPNSCPVDMHTAVALVAPRGLFIMDNPHIANLGPKSAHLSATAGSRVYEALGAGGNITYHSNVADGGHCAWRSEWTAVLQDNIKRFLLRTAAPPAAPVINPRAGITGNTALITWTTPVLPGELGGGGTVPKGYTLTVVTSPAIYKTPMTDGTLSIIHPKSAGNRYEEGTEVIFAVCSPMGGWKFAGWEGDSVYLTDNGPDIIAVCVKDAIIMDANKTVIAKFVPTKDGTDNFIKNGTFANTQNWTLNQWSNSAGTFTVSDENANIAIATLPSGAGAADHSLQLVQNGVPLYQGIKYRLTFDASAASAREMSVYMQLDSSPYTEYLANTVNLAAAKASFTCEFEMTAPSDENARIAFNIGGSKENITISNVRLIYIADFTPSTIRHNKTSAISPKSLLRTTVLPNSAINVNFRAVNSGVSTIKLYSLKGDAVSMTKIQTVSGHDYSHKFNAGKLPSGFYIVGLYGDSGRIGQSKILLRR